MDGTAHETAAEDAVSTTPATTPATAPATAPDTAPQTPPAGTAAADVPPHRGRLRRIGHRVSHPLPGLTVPGLWGAVLFACLSFTPSLLPRSGVTQGIVCGISAAIGYGLGVAAAWIWRAFADRDARAPRHRSVLVLAIGGGALLATFFGLGQWWQARIRDLMGVSDYNLLLVVLSPVFAVVVFVLLVLLGRGIRGVYRWSVRLLSSWFGARAARATGWIAVAALVYLVISGILFNGFISLANQTFSLRDGITPEGITQPTSSLRSGGPGSLAKWDELGREGRKFVATGPDAAEIQSFTGRAADEPIRVYAGLKSADDTESRAALAAQELERTGAFARKNLLVVTTTGSGWVDPALVDSFEYLTDGDSAVAAMQYSYLPSWISYLVDQSKARAAGRDLYDAVYDRWSKLPLDSRPKLWVAGESLGSFGGEAAFSGEYDLRNRTAGTIFAGPPNFNTLFREFTDNRDSGTREVAPTYKNGRTVRFTSDPAAGIAPTGQPWDGTRVLYLMHASDPIVWWSPNLLLHKPDWISEKPGQDVLGGTVWIPFVTFWQVTADLPFATGVPSGHGHKYTTEYVDAWVSVMRPAGVTTADVDRLKTIIAGEG